MLSLKRFAFLLCLAGSTPGLSAPQDIPRHMQKMADELKLTPEQRASIQKIHKDSFDAIKAHRLALKESRKQLETAVGKADAKPEELTAIHEKLVQAKTEAMRLRFANLIQIRALLTPEQLTKFSQAALEKGRGRGPHAGHDASGPFEENEDAQ